MNLHSEQYVFKYGALVQFGVSYMQGFSSFADEFLLNFDLYKPIVDESGYSDEWIQWQKQNIDNIIQLYDELNASNLIPNNN